jgi:Leucine-rich repeat (LRR) protein
MNLPKLRRFNCSDNKLTSLPLCILNFKNLQVFTDNNNEIELSLQISQFIDRIKNKKNKKRVKDRERKKRRKIKLLAQFDANKV